MKIKFNIKPLLLVIALAWVSHANAQQDPMYTQYMFNLSTVNSAAIGRSDNVALMMVNRYQWVGFEGAPKTLSLTADVPLKFFNSGAGISYVYDQVGPTQSNTIYLDYAYHIQLARNLKLGMGLKAGMKVFSANLSDLGQEGVADDQFASNINGDVMPNFGLGLFAYSDNYYVGVSSPKLVNHKYEGSDNSSGKEERHYFVIAGYVLPISSEVVFKPSVLTKFVKGAPMSYDITANFLFKDMLWAGVAYRSGDAISLLTQIQLSNRFRFGYAYDIGISKVSTVSSGSHELMLSYEFKPFKEKVRSPRYF